MSVASVHPAVISPLAHMLGMRCLSVASSLDKLSTYDNYVELHDLYHSINSDTVMTIEQLRAYNNSCFSCGVNWTEQHVSLDCSECGGYALMRPCADCEGKCGATWKRNSALSHANGKARWDGDCGLRAKAKRETRQTLSEICQRFEASVNKECAS